MNILSPTEAFSQGSELWIIPDRRNSYWARRIDWHLQFLISRSMAHESPQISPELKRIVTDNEIDNEIGDISKSAPLLIFSVDLLPNRETVHLPFGNNFKTWIERASSVWQNLKKPTVRVFLPRTQNIDEFKNHWADLDDTVSVVVDTESKG